jgi:hypothetical protein
MPYNTRRKSLSLPSLGIHLPSSSRRSPSISSTKTSTPSTEDHQLPPSKKVKRSHDSLSVSPEPLSRQSPAVRAATWEHTPPPSPMDDGLAPRIDTEGINDDIVVGVIHQLEKTANRPHLVKELAAILYTLNDNVANSANPAALLSSRLSAYMKRSWSALAPCPIAKELIPVHPRKVYYYLTTMPRQPLPDNSDDIMIPSGMIGKQMTPSVTSVEQDDEDIFVRQRSPSPEVDLSSPDFEDEHVNLNGRPDGTARPASDFHAHMRLMHSHRAASPPLEGDEKEFTQTASAVRERASEQKASQGQTGAARSGISEGLSQMDSINVSTSSHLDDSPSSSFSGDRMSDDFEYGDYFSHSGPLDHQSPAPKQQQGQDDDAACALLGTSPSPSLTSVASSLSSSAPSDAGLDTEVRPQIALPEVAHVSPLKRSIDMLNSGLPDVDIKMSDLAESEDKVAIKARPLSNMDVDTAFDSWRELQSPETVEVDELDEMFGEI